MHEVPTYFLFENLSCYKTTITVYVSTFIALVFFLNSSKFFFGIEILFATLTRKLKIFSKFRFFARL